MPAALVRDNVQQVGNSCEIIPDRVVQDPSAKLITLVLSKEINHLKQNFDLRIILLLPILMWSIAMVSYIEIQ